MKSIFAAFGLAFAAVAATPGAAPATTFPVLTFIYAASGVYNSGTNGNGTATSVICTNLSGQTANVRWTFYNENGGASVPMTLAMANLKTQTVSTHLTNALNDVGLSMGTVKQGSVLIQSTQSGVFCTAMILDAAAVAPNGTDLHMVRFNAHPNTVE